MNGKTSAIRIVWKKILLIFQEEVQNSHVVVFTNFG